MQHWFFFCGSPTTRVGSRRELCLSLSEEPFSNDPFDTLIDGSTVVFLLFHITTQIANMKRELLGVPGGEKVGGEESWILFLRQRRNSVLGSS